jgi:hypothetical protein
MPAKQREMPRSLKRGVMRIEAVGAQIPYHRPRVQGGPRHRDRVVSG